MLLLFAQVSLAQTKPAAKSVKPTTRPVPDLIGLITVNPDMVHGSTNMTAFIDIIETKKVATTGPIKVLVQKNLSYIQFKFDPTATSIGQSRVLNANWSFDETTNPNFYIFTSTKVIPGGGFSTIALTGVFSSLSTGQTAINMSIAKGSGGETNNLNNSSSSAIRYSNN
ncbi:hypothetical protein GCM10028773_16200 [Spirosoma koreense]